jgi:hypothetical protein
MERARVPSASGDIEADGQLKPKNVSNLKSAPHNNRAQLDPKQKWRQQT